MSNMTMKQLSKELNVSIATVSKALRNSYEISEVTKKRILKYAQKAGYRPHPYAGSLKRNRSKTIALIVPELLNNFFSQAILGAEQVAKENGYHVLIYNTMNDIKREKSIMKDLQNGRVDGVIMSVADTTNTDDHINELILSGTPVVFFDRIRHEIETAKITTNDFTSGFNATEHLIQHGCKDIAYLSVSENLSIDNKREQGYMEALAKHNYKVNKERIIICNGDEDYNLMKIKTLLKGRKLPDGVFASVEKLALLFYKACLEMKIKIPDQIKVISFSNLRSAPLLNPPLSTISQPATEMGEKAATVLFKYLSKRRPLIENENFVINSELIARESTLGH